MLSYLTLCYLILSYYSYLLGGSFASGEQHDIKENYMPSHGLESCLDAHGEQIYTRTFTHYASCSANVPHAMWCSIYGAR